MGESSESLPNFNSYYKQEDERSIGSKADSDTSWKLLNQVASIEEEKFRNAEAGRLGATSPIDERSRSSKQSVEEKKYANLPSPSKMAPLTSLASVSSVAEPLDTSSFSKDHLPPLAEKSKASTYLAPFDNHRDKEKHDSSRDDMLASSSLLWEIKGQDSFGGALSVGSNMSVHAGDGPVITSSFSF